MISNGVLLTYACLVQEAVAGFAAEVAVEVAPEWRGQVSLTPLASVAELTA